MVFLKMERDLVRGQALGIEQRRGIGRQRITQSGKVMRSASLFETGQHDAWLATQAMSEVRPPALHRRRINPPAGQRDDYERRPSGMWPSARRVFLGRPDKLPIADGNCQTQTFRP